MRAICSSSITIIDMNDITSSDTAPKKPFSGMLWMDTSMTPPVLKVWKDGVWVIQSDETIGTSNLLRNTGLRKDASGWSFSSGIARDTSKKKGNNNSLKYHVTGLTADAWRSGQPSQIEVDAYKRYSAACEVFIPTNHGIDRGIALEVQWFDGNGARVKWDGIEINTNVTGRWQRVTIERLRVPSGAVKANARVYVRQNGLFYVAELMMSEGAKIGSWVAHKDDIQDEVEDTVNEAIVAQTQEEIFNKLTNNGESQGIFMDENKNFYINGEYIRGENLNIVRHSDKQSTFKVTSDGEVEINAKALSILGTNVATSNEVQTAVKDTVILMNTMYYLSTSNTSLVGGSWSTVAPNWVNGKYMWMKNVMTLKSGKVVESNPTCIAGATGATGSTGATGTGVSNLTVEYYLSTSKTTQTGGSWVTTPPTWSVGRYLWTRNKIVYINPSSTQYTTPVCDSSWEVVNEVTIGGRNMLEKTDIDKYGLGNWIQNNGTLSVDSSKLYTDRKSIKVVGNTGIQYNGFIKLARNTTYTYSAMLCPNSDLSITGTDPLHMWVSTAENANHLEIIKSTSHTAIPANKWTKVWVVFSTPDTADIYYMRPFLYGIGNVTVNMCQPMLEKGNKASDWSEAPEDIQANIQDVGNALNSFKNTVNGAFKDGIIEQAEAKAIEQHLKTLDVEKSDIDKEYTTVYNNTLLNGTAKTNLASAKSSYDSAHTSLKSTIRTAIADGRITTSEKTSVDNAFATYNTALGTYRQRLQESLDFINNAKANNAKNEAISSANSTLTNTIANYYTKTQTDSAIKVSSDAINLGVSQTYETKAEVTNKVNHAISGIQLGGTNLFRNSGFTSGVERWESYSTSSVGVVKVNDSKSGHAVSFNSTGGGIYQRYVDKAGTVQNHPQGTTLTISGYFKCSSRAHLAVALEGSFSKNFTPPSANTWTKFEVTGVANGSSHTVTFYGVNGNTYHLKDLKLESGNKATDWSPAPEDTELLVLNAKNEAKEYTKSQISIAKDEINLGVSQTYETKSNVESKISTSKTEVINSAKSYADTKKAEAINAASADATNKVNSAKNELNTAIGKKANSADVYTKSETYTQAQADSAIKVAREAIELGVKNTYETKTNVESKITTAVNNVQVGGRNLIRTSYIVNRGCTTFTYDKATNTWSCVAPKGSDSWGYGFTINSNEKIAVERGKTLIVSLEVNPEVDCTWNNDVNNYYNGATSGNDHDDTSKRANSIRSLKANQWTKCWFSYTAKSNVSYDLYDARSNWGIVTTSSSNPISFKIRNVKAEYGNKPTDWTPAPEDVDNSISSAKQEAINTASADATTKANNALNNAKTYANDKKTEAINSANSTLSSTIANYYTKQDTDSRIKVAKESIELNVSNNYETKSEVTNKVNNAINNIQVGSRNWVQNSEFKSTTGWAIGGGWSVNTSEKFRNNNSMYINRSGLTADSWTELRSNKINVKQGDKLVGSWYIKYRDCEDSIVCLWGYKADGTGRVDLANIHWLQGTNANWRRYVLKGTVPANVDYVQLAISHKKNGIIYASMPQVEYGNTATDWSPAPEDTKLLVSQATNESKEYTNSQIQIAKDAINLGVSQTYETKANVSSQVATSLNNAKSYADSKKTEAINTASSDATHKANNALNNAKTYANDKKNEAITSANNTLTSTIANYYTKTQTDSAIKIAKDQIDLSVQTNYETKSEVTNKVNTAVNGIQIGSRNLALNSNNEVSNNDYYVTSYMPSELFKVGDTYTITLCVTPAHGVSQYSLFVSSGWKYLTPLAVSGTSKQIVSATFKFNGYYADRIPTDPTHRHARLELYRLPNDNTVTSNSTVHWVKVEKGNKATDWSPAPEDIDNSISSVKDEAKEYTNSQIQIAKDAINLGVSQTYETKTEVDKKINNIQVGSRNLIPNSKTLLLNSSDYGNNDCSVVENDYVKITPKNNGNVWAWLQTAVARLQGETYTLSFEVLTSTKLGIYWYPSETYAKADYVNASEKWQRVSFTYTQTNADNAGDALFGFHQLVKGNVYKYRNLKLEIGNKYTDWSPAPEDVDASITSAKSEFKEYTNSQIQIAKNEINLEVKNTYETKSEVTNKVNNAVNGIQIGGRNLIKKKSNFKCGYIDAANGSEQGVGDSLNSNQDFFTVEYFSLKRGETVCFTSYPKQDVTSNIHSAVYIHVYNTSKTWQKAVNIISGGSNKVVSKIYTATEDCYIRFSARGFNDYNHMAEYATKSSQWSPAPEDVESAINDVQIGTRNLVYQSPTLNNQFHQLNTYRGVKTIVDDSSAKSKKHIKFECTTAGTGFYAVIWNGDDSCIGKQFTWSFYAKMNKSKKLNSIGHERGGMISIDVTTEWKKFTHTWTYASSGNRAFVFYPNFEVGDIFYIKDLKIEEGNRATDWTPAPEDTENLVFSAKNEVKQYTDSQIQIAKDAINLGVSQTYETQSNVTTKFNQAVVDSRKIPDTRNDNQNPLWYMTHYPSQTITEFKAHTAMGLSNSVGTYGAVTTVVPWRDSSGGYPVQTWRSNTNNSTYERRGTSNTTWGSWRQIEDAAGAQAKATNAKNEAVSSANNTLNSTIANYYTKQDTDSRIKVATDAIDLSVKTNYETKTEVENKITTAVNNVQMGGTNIAKDTKTFKGWNRVSASDLNEKYGNLTVYHNKYTASSSYADLQLTNAITPEPNTEYTLSYWAKGTGAIINYFYPSCVASGIGSQGQKTASSDGNVMFTLSPNWTRHWVTWTTKSDVSGAKSLIVSRQMSSNSEAWVCGVKLEKGNKPSDWSPAPEDVDTSISSAKNEVKEYTNSQIQIAKDAINLGVSQTYETKSNVSSQVNSTLNSAKSYADTKKTEAINTASSDATSKANNALSNAKSYADVKKTEAISSANSTLNSTIANYYTKTQTDSQIKVARESIELGVKNTYETKTEVTNKINSVQVGGRNLIKNSNFIVQATSSAFAPGKTVALVDGINLNETFLGKTVVFSYFVHCIGNKTNGSGDLGKRFGIHGTVKWKNSTTGATKIDYPFANYLEGSYKNTRVSMSHTFNPPTGFDSIADFAFAFQPLAKPSPDNKEVWKIGQPKLEIGTKSTDWSPAPEDTEASISSAKSEVKQYTDSQIKIAKESIDLNVKNTYETKSNVENKINTAVSNVQIGGRNIFRYSGNFGTDAKGYWENNGGGLTFDTSVTYNGFNTIKTTVGTGIRGIWYKLEPNIEYTYSALIRCNETFTGNGVVPLHYHSGTNDTNQGKISILKTDTTYPVANQWKLLSITFKLTGDANSFRPFIYWGSGSRVFNIAYIKLEKGNKASDWVPAPEDLTERIESAEAGIRINTDSITNTVKKTDYTGQNLVSMINQTADTVKISAKHIDINGVVSFSSFDKSTQDKITAIQNTASSASSTANTAKTTADSAKTTANTASTNASTALNTANTAKNTADTAKSTADSAKSTATSAQSTANSAKSVADSANGKVAAWCHSNNTTLIDGGKIYTGSITAQQIASSAITADKLTIGRKDNLVNNFNFANDSVNSSPIGWSNIPNGVISTSGTLSQKAVRIFGNGSIKDYTEISNKIYVSPNEKFYIEYKICRNPEANGTAQFGAFIYQSNGSIASYSSVSRNASNVTASAWHTIKGEITVPSNGAYMIPWMSVRNDCTAGFWEFSDLKLVRMTTGEIIVNGAITANKLHSDVLSSNNIVSIINGGSTTISGNKITTGSITADKLLVKDFTNLADMLSDKGYDDVMTVSSRHTTISSMRSASDISEGDAFIIELWAKTYDSTTTLPLNFMAVIEKFSGTVNYPQVAIAQAQSSREWTKYKAVLKFDAGHVYDLKAFRFDLFISKDFSATSTQKWQVKQVIVRKMSNGRLIVDGSITADMITSGTFRGTNFIAGGNSNGNGYISVLGSSNDILFRANKEGLYAKNIVFGITPDFNFKTDGYYWADGYGFHGEQGFDDGTLNRWSQKTSVNINGLRLEKTGEYQVNTGITTVEAHQIVVSSANQGQSSYMTRSQVKSGGEVQAETHVRAKGEVIAEGAITSRGGVYGSSFVQTNYGTPIEIGKYIDMHQTGSNTDVDVRIEASSRQGIRIERGDNLSQYVEIGVGTTDRYFYNSTSGKYFTLKNDGRLAYDGYTVPHNWRQSFSPFIYSDSGRFNMAEGWGEAVYLGDLVWIRGRVRGSRGGHSGSIYIGGLPVSSCGGYPALEFAFFGGVTGNLGGAGFDVRSYIEGNAAHAFITYSNKDTGGWHNLQCSHVTTGNMDISFSATYRWR